MTNGKVMNIIICICFAFILCTDSFALQKMNIDPPRVEVVLPVGGEEGGYISVSNQDEEEAMHVKAYVNDLVYLPDGSNDFLPPGTTPWSCGDMLRIGPTEFDIQPGEEGRLRYVVSIPEGASGGKYGVVFFELSPSLEALTGRGGAAVNIRLGSIVLIEVKGTQTYLAVLNDMGINRLEGEDGAFVIFCTVYNGSNILVRPNGVIKIINDTEEVVAELDMNKEKTGVFPATSRTFYTKYSGEKLEPGTYYLQAVLDYGGDAYLGGQKKFEVQ